MEVGHCILLVGFVVFLVLPIVLEPPANNDSMGENLLAVSTEPEPPLSVPNDAAILLKPTAAVGSRQSQRTPTPTPTFNSASMPSILKLDGYDRDHQGTLSQAEFLVGCGRICSRLHCGEVDCQVRRMFSCNRSKM